MLARYVYYPNVRFPLTDWPGDGGTDTFAVTCTRSEVTSLGLMVVLSEEDQRLLDQIVGDPVWVGPDSTLTLLIARDRSCARLVPWSYIFNSNVWSGETLFHPIGSITNEIADGVNIVSLDDLTELSPRPS